MGGQPLPAQGSFPRKSGSGRDLIGQERPDFVAAGAKLCRLALVYHTDFGDLQPRSAPFPRAVNQFVGAGVYKSKNIGALAIVQCNRKTSWRCWGAHLNLGHG